MRRPSSKSESEEQPPKDEDTSSESEKPPKKEPPKEPTIFEKYGIEKDKYDEWDWLRDVGFSMMSNEGTGILDSFGIGATKASENLREASKSNRELKNKLKIKEAEAAAKAAAAKPVSFEFNGKKYMQVKRPIPGGDYVTHESHPGKFFVIESPDVEDTDPLGYLTSADRTTQGLLADGVMEDLGLFNTEDPEVKKERAELYDRIREESSKAKPNRNFIAAWGESLDRLTSRSTGIWADMSSGRRTKLLNRAEAATVAEIKKLPADASYSREDIFTSNFKRIVQNLELGTAAQKKDWAKTDDRFNLTTQNESLRILGNLVGKDVVDRWSETSWFDAIDEEVKAALKNGLFTEDQFELLLENEGRAHSFMGDLAAKAQELADEKQLSADDPAMEPIIRDFAIYAVNQIHGGKDNWFFSGDPDQPANYTSFMDYQTPPVGFSEYSNRGWQWKKSSTGEWGYFSPDGKSWASQSNLINQKVR